MARFGIALRTGTSDQKLRWTAASARWGQFRQLPIAAALRRQTHTIRRGMGHLHAVPAFQQAGLCAAGT